MTWASKMTRVGGVPVRQPRPDETILRNQVRHSIEFVKSGRGKEKCKPDPIVPKGTVVNACRNDEPSCTVKLPYPAPECGHFIVRCKDCGLSVVATAAGRPDDPIRITMPCDLPTKSAANA
jgi:hypothetical protein